jgi:hypothetical protein
MPRDQKQPAVSGSIAVPTDERRIMLPLESQYSDLLQHGHARTCARLGLGTERQVQAGADPNLEHAPFRRSD